MGDPLNAWPEFAAARERPEQVRAEYRDCSFIRPPGELLAERQEEALDLAGWGFVMWSRIEVLRVVVEPGDPALDTSV